MILQASYHATFLASRQVNIQEYVNPSLPNTSQNVKHCSYQCDKTTYPSTNKRKALLLAATKHLNVNSTIGHPHIPYIYHGNLQKIGKKSNSFRNQWHFRNNRLSFGKLKNRYPIANLPEDGGGAPRPIAANSELTFCPASSRILISSLANLALAAVKKVYAVPFAPALPVRPIR